EQMLPVFKTFDRHPLLIQVLAGVVAEFRDAPGDFDTWWKVNADFRVFDLPIVQVRSHILEYAFRGLSEGERQALNVIAGFRMPTNISTLRALLISDKRKKSQGRHEVAGTCTGRPRVISRTGGKATLPTNGRRRNGWMDGRN